jgi:hypothetical protein
MAYEKAVHEFSKIPGVKFQQYRRLWAATDWSDDVRTGKDKDAVVVREYFTDENYTSNFI